MLCYIYIIFYWRFVTIVFTASLCILLCTVFGINTTKIECLKSQVEWVSFQHGMAELVRAPIPRRIPTWKLWCVRLSPDSDLHLSLKTARGHSRASVVPIFSPATAPPFSTPAQFSIHLLSRSNMRKYVQWCVGSSPDFEAQVFSKCFLHLVAKNKRLRSRTCRLHAKRDWVPFFRKRLFILMYKISGMDSILERKGVVL